MRTTADAIVAALAALAAGRLDHRAIDCVLRSGCSPAMAVRACIEHYAGDRSPPWPRGWLPRSRVLAATRRIQIPLAREMSRRAGGIAGRRMATEEPAS